MGNGTGPTRKSVGGGIIRGVGLGLLALLSAGCMVWLVRIVVDAAIMAQGTQPPPEPYMRTITLIVIASLVAMLLLALASLILSALSGSTSARRGGIAAATATIGVSFVLNLVALGPWSPSSWMASVVDEAPFLACWVFPMLIAAAVGGVIGARRLRREPSAQATRGGWRWLGVGTAVIPLACVLLLGVTSLLTDGLNTVQLVRIPSEAQQPTESAVETKGRRVTFTRYGFSLELPSAEWDADALEQDRQADVGVFMSGGGLETFVFKRNGDFVDEEASVPPAIAVAVYDIPKGWDSARFSREMRKLTMGDPEFTTLQGANASNENSLVPGLPDALVYRVSFTEPDNDVYLVHVAGGSRGIAVTMEARRAVWAQADAEFLRSLKSLSWAE
jgi:hypothetical protein